MASVWRSVWVLRCVQYDHAWLRMRNWGQCRCLSYLSKRATTTCLFSLCSDVTLSKPDPIPSRIYLDHHSLGLKFSQWLFKNSLACNPRAWEFCSQQGFSVSHMSLIAPYLVFRPDGMASWTPQDYHYLSASIHDFPSIGISFSRASLVKLPIP
jgi:hypothetical protein